MDPDTLAVVVLEEMVVSEEDPEAADLEEDPEEVLLDPNTDNNRERGFKDINIFYCYILQCQIAIDLPLLSFFMNPTFVFFCFLCSILSFK